MSNFTQDFRTQRRNYEDGNTRIGEEGRLWYDSITNTIRIGDGSTPGGIVLGGGGGGATTIGGLLDVDVTGVINGSVLKYDSGTWIIGTDNEGTTIASINDIADVNTAGVIDGSVLKYQSGTWVVGTDNAGTTIASIGDIADVDTSGIQNNSVLKYNSVSGNWEIGVDEDTDTGATNLNELTDVDTTGQTTGSLLRYSGAAWVVSNTLPSLTIDNITIDGNDISATDVDGNISLIPNGNGTVEVNSSRITGVTDPTGAQDAATKNYVDTEITSTRSYVDSEIAGLTIPGALNDLSDVNTSGASNGSVLKFSGGTWSVGTDDSGSTDLDGLSDVSTAGVFTGAVLKFNGSTWAPATDETTELDGSSIFIPEDVIRAEFESVSQNLRSYPYDLIYTGETLTSIEYTTDDSSIITKTLNYSGETLTSVTLSGATPSGIELTKTILYSGEQVIGVTYS